MSDSLWPYGLQHARLLCPPLPPGVCSNLCPLSQWCHPTISSAVAFFPLFSIFACIRVFSNQLALHIRWPKFWSFSFSISPSSENSVISFRTDWFDLLALLKLLTLIKIYYKSMPWFMSTSVLPMFSSRSFMVYSPTFRSSTHFEFIFVYGVRECCNFILSYVAVQFSQHHLLKRLSSPYCIFLPPLLC